MTRRETALALVVGLVAAAAAVKYVSERTLPEFDHSAEVLILGASQMVRWPERSPDTYADTFGPSVTSAAKVGWTAARLLRALPIETSAHTIVVDTGSCDLRRGRSPLDTALDVTAVVDTLLDTTDAGIVVLAILPRRVEAGDLEGERLAEETNAYTRELLYGVERVTFVDATVPHDARHFRDDAIHLSPEGYRVLGAQIRPALEDRRGPLMLVGGAP